MVGHVQRRDSEYIGRRMIKVEPPGRRQRGRPKRRFLDVVRENMQVVGVTEEATEDRDRWRRSLWGLLEYLGKAGRGGRRQNSQMADVQMSSPISQYSLMHPLQVKTHSFSLHREMFPPEKDKTTTLESHCFQTNKYLLVHP